MQISGGGFIIFDQPLKLRAGHIRKNKKSILTKIALSNFLKLCGFIKRTCKTQQSDTIEFIGKFLQGDLYRPDTFLLLIVSKRIVLATTYYTENVEEFWEIIYLYSNC